MNINTDKFNKLLDKIKDPNQREIIHKPIQLPQNRKQNQWTSYFKHIYYINLDERIDRRKETEKELQKYNIIATRISAIKPNIPNKRDRGKLGCKLSHKSIIELAIINNYENVLIFEDDIELSKDFNDYMNIAVNQLQQEPWDLFYLFTKRTRRTWKKFRRHTSHLIKSTGTIFTHAYAVNQKCLKFFITLMNKNGAIDIILLRSNFNIFGTAKNIAGQRHSRSDISRKGCSAHIDGD